MFPRPPYSLFSLTVDYWISQSLENDLGSEWMSHWHEELPFYAETPGEINVREILRLWTFDRGLGLRELAKMRYRQP